MLEAKEGFCERTYQSLTFPIADVYILTNWRGGARVQAYCFKCRKKVDIQSPANVTLKNGKSATKGKCGKCGTTVFRIGKG